MWHGYGTMQSFGPGAALLITGGDEAVELAAGDVLGIDFPGGVQREAAVLLCERDRLVLLLDAVRTVELKRILDQTGAFADFKLAGGFSRQTWLVA